MGIHIHTQAQTLLQPKLVALYTLFSSPKSLHCCDCMLDLTVIFFFPSVLSCGLNVKLRGSWEVLHFLPEVLTPVLLCCFRTRGLETGNGGG